MIATAIPEDTTTEESVVFPEFIICDSEIYRSIVGQQTDVESLNLADAVIRTHTKLSGN